MNVVIQSLADAAEGKGIVEGITSHGQYIKVENLTVSILEGGTVGGRTSVMFVLQPADGKPIVAECTGGQFEMLVGAFRGAVARFEQ